MEDGDREAVPIFPSSSLVNTMDVKIFFAHVVLQRSHTFLASGSVFDFQDVLFCSSLVILHLFRVNDSF